MGHLEQLNAAQDAIETEQYSIAIAILEPLCEIDDTMAQSILGSLYHLGLGVPVNGIKAVALLSAAAEKGNGVAAHNLGTIYVTGLPGVERDTKRSRFYYRMARDLGSQFAPDSFYD